MMLVAALACPGFLGAIVGVAMESIAIATMAGFHGMHAPVATQPHPAGLFAAIAVTAFLGIAVWVVAAWLWCRLRFTLFDLVLRQHGRVGLSWSRSGQPALRFLGLVLLATVAFVLLIAVTVGPFVLHLVLLFRSLTPQQVNADPFLVVENIFPMYGIFFLAVLVAAVVGAVMLDFMLPPLAIESASVASAAGRLFRLLRTDFWWVALYLLLRFVMRLAISWIGSVALLIILLVLGGGGAGLGYLLYGVLWHRGTGPATVFVLYCVIAGLAVLAAYVLAIMMLYGIMTAWVQSYAIYFFGSHYQELGNLLEPSGSALSTEEPPPPIPGAGPGPLPDPPSVG
jgi:hypothetical protein